MSTKTTTTTADGVLDKCPPLPHPHMGADEFNLKMEDKRRLRKLAYGHVFGSREGKMVLDDLMQMAGWRMGVEGCLFYDNASHAQMAFHEGEREVVRHILRLIRE